MPPSDERVHKGHPAAPGFAAGPIAHLGAVVEAPGRSGTPTDERQRLDTALTAAADGLTALMAEGDDLSGEILEFQLMLLDDDDIIAPIRASIDAGMGAVTAWRETLDTEIAEYASGEDAYLAARASDLRDLRDRVLTSLAGGTTAPTVPAGAIVVADDLGPSTFLDLRRRTPAGIALMNGSPTSHAAILARAHGVPMVVGLGATLACDDGCPALLDAETGSLTTHPADQTVTAFKDKAAEDAQMTARAMAVQDGPAKTAEGEDIRVLINVDDPAILDTLSPTICDGIGLMRSEFLFSTGAPDEETQYRAYAKILSWADGRPVTIRTLDAGGDKPIPGVTIDSEQNPFLGTRGLRLSLTQPQIFRTQLRALARAAALGPLKIMLPMVTVPDELEHARNHLDQVITELTEGNIPHQRPALGIMVETPAAALTAKAFEAAFYSIGTNDLIQYTMAAARDGTGVMHLADPTNSGVLELIRKTIEAGQSRDVEVSLCGDMASRPDLTSRLLDLGLRTFSVAPALVGRVKLAIGGA